MVPGVLSVGNLARVRPARKDRAITGTDALPGSYRSDIRVLHCGCQGRHPGTGGVVQWRNGACSQRPWNAGRKLPEELWILVPAFEPWIRGTLPLPLQGHPDESDCSVRRLSTVRYRTRNPRTIPGVRQERGRCCVTQGKPGRARGQIFSPSRSDCSSSPWNRHPGIEPRCYYRIR